MLHVCRFWAEFGEMQKKPGIKSSRMSRVERVTLQASFRPLSNRIESNRINLLPVDLDLPQGYLQQIYQLLICVSFAASSSTHKM